MRRAGGFDHRPGYYADKEWAKQNGVERERQIEEALMLENPITDITIALELNYFQITRPEYLVPISVKIPGSELELAQRRGRQRMTLDFLIEVKDGTAPRSGTCAIGWKSSSPTRRRSGWRRIPFSTTAASPCFPATT